MNKSEIKEKLLKDIKILGRSYKYWVIRVGKDKFRTDDKIMVKMIKKIRHQIIETFK